MTRAFSIVALWFGFAWSGLVALGFLPPGSYHGDEFLVLELWHLVL